MSYNGWKNYETWNVALWLDNNEGNYYEVRDMVQQVAEALTALRPAEVQQADAAGISVTRQGDVFGIAYPELRTRELTEAGHSAYVAGVNHTVTERRTDAWGNEYGRGTLRHRPRESWRQPEHRMQRLGDGRTWHKILRNTVPMGRSWSIDGKVD